VDFARKPNTGLLGAAMGPMVEPVMEPVVSSTSSASQSVAKVDAATVRHQLILVADDTANYCAHRVST